MPEFAFFTLAPATAAPIVSAVQMPQASSLTKGESADSSDDFSAFLQQASEQQIQDNHQNNCNNDNNKETEIIEDNTTPQVETETTPQANAESVPDDDSALPETAEQIDKKQPESSEKQLIDNITDTNDIASSAQNDKNSEFELEDRQQRKETVGHSNALHKEVVSEETQQNQQAIKQKNQQNSAQTKKPYQNNQLTEKNAFAAKTKMEAASPLLSTDKTEQTEQIETKIPPLQESELVTTASGKKPLSVAPQNSVVNRESFTLSVNVSQQQTLQGESEGITRQSIEQTDLILARLQNIIDAGKETKTAAISIAQTQTTTISMDDMATLRKDGQKPLTERQIIQEWEKTERIQTTSSTAKLFTILNEDFSEDASPQPKFLANKIEKDTSGNALGQKISTTGQLSTTEKISTAETLSTVTMVKESISDNTGRKFQPQATEILSQEKAKNPASSTASQNPPLNNDLSKEENIVANLVQTENNKKEKQAEQKPERNNISSKAATVSPSLENSPFSSDTSNSGSFFGGQTGQSGVIETPSTPTPTITLPSGVVVREDEIVRQFIDKFQINGRNLESRINIKLNPVELGEIKIALTVKEKSIKADVVAQSQITRQILEKNLGKLKNMLERQGFDIDAINITSSDELLSEFNLFEQEFKRKQQKKQGKRPAATVPDQEDTEQQTEQEDSINLVI